MQLYEQDAYCQAFETKVLDCTQIGEDSFKIRLENTAFYPEGGGQPWDTGFLNESQVLEVHKKENHIIHHCTKALTIGEKVKGQIDWDRRFDFMQLHSGEHIVSGLAHSMFSCDNVGFHMGKELVTIDFNVELNETQVKELEKRSNQYIWENHPISITYPNEIELKTLDYRSKKELTGDVRIVSFPEADCCACCGTHVSYSGEIGFIVLLSCQKFREGVRIELLCGARAFAYLKEIKEQNTSISQLLSAKTLVTAIAVERLKKEKEQLEFQRLELEKKYISMIVNNYENTEKVCLFLDDFTPDSLRVLAGELAGKVSSYVLCFSPFESVFRFAFASKQDDMRLISNELKEKFSLRGGGKANLVQGTITATKEELETYFNDL